MKENEEWKITPKFGVNYWAVDDAIDDIKGNLMRTLYG